MSRRPPESPLGNALQQKSWSAECRDCPFSDRSPKAAISGPRHSRESGHEVSVRIVLAGVFIGGIAR